MEIHLIETPIQLVEGISFQITQIPTEGIQMIVMTEEVQPLEEVIPQIMTNTTLLEETQLMTPIHQAGGYLLQQQEVVALPQGLLLVHHQHLEEEVINTK